MNNQGSVNLSKSVRPEPWTDPVTGEVYPGGNPNAVPQPVNSTVNMAQQPYSGVVQPNSMPNYGGGAYTQSNVPNGATKFCSHCGGVIAREAVICPQCGCQVEQFQYANQPAPTPVIINNNVSNVNNANTTVPMGRQKNKWVAFCLCFFFGYLGAHRFYEGKIGTGILYLFTGGLFGIGWLVDLIIILTKSDPYYVN